jgi:hypothetical protein
MKPIISNMYQYHLFPVLFIFILISFVALFDDIRIIRRVKEKKGIHSWMCESYYGHSGRRLWMVLNRWLVLLEEDPKAGLLMQSTDWTSIHLGIIEISKFVIPNWYLLAIAMALAGPVTMTGK